MILSTAYFPPIEFFALLAENSVVYLEACEHYEKQSWRNRCRILTANGPMDLRVPVVHSGDLFHTPVKDVRVDYSTPWVARTEYAIESAYCSSPFFIYYKDELFAILDSHPGTLWELDLKLIDFFIRKIGLATIVVPTSEYVPSGSMVPCRTSLRSSHRCAALAVPPFTWSRAATVPQATVLPEGMASTERTIPLEEDYRGRIHPKKPSGYVGRPYWQVFREKFGFVDGLSVMDLLFNEGPESLCYLK